MRRLLGRRPITTLCREWLGGGGMDIPIAHTVELLDWAYGGPMPRGLEALAKHVQNVPEAKPLVAVT